MKLILLLNFMFYCLIFLLLNFINFFLINIILLLYNNMVDYFKVTLLVICLFIFLYYIRHINKLKENFVGNLKQKEYFENEIPNVNLLKPKKNDNIINTQNTSNSNESCEIANKQDNTKDDCVFGCSKTDDGDVEEMDINDMMKTIEETEKLCDMIDEKDRIRREREDIENIDKQIELNKKFLLQQNSQNKQIEDLQGIIKSMVFTDDMNKVAVEKCSGKTDECLSDKEQKLSSILNEKREKNKKVKINLNMDSFGGDIKSSLISKLGASGAEAERLTELINTGDINIDDLQRQSGNVTYEDGSTTRDCPNCKIDLSKYIDRCKIPCRKCRDPAWGCPQDK